MEQKKIIISQEEFFSLTFDERKDLISHNVVIDFVPEIKTAEQLQREGVF